MKEVKQNKEPWFKTRDVLWYMVFSGFAINYMLRINLNIAIVSMVPAKPPKVGHLSSECLAPPPGGLNLSENNTFTPSIYKPPLDHSEHFNWSEYEQNLILGSYFWLYWMTQLPGGILATKYGTKIVFGLSNLAGCLLCFVIPMASHWGVNYLIFVRILQGFVTGFSWPSMHNMTARWIPPNERSKFVTAYLGSSLGAGLTFPMCGYIIATSGWELVFHVCGVIGVVWYVLWHLLVFDTPAEHPRITHTEKEFIRKSLGRSVSTEKAPIPWKSILTSVPVWLNIFAQWGGIWGLFTTMTHTPTYFNVIHGLNIRATGFLSGLPHLLRTLFAYIFSQFGDYLLKANKMSRTNVRKLAVAICCGVQGICMLALAFAGCDYVAAIIFLTGATTSHGSVSTGSMASFVDLSPNYASIQMGLSGFISVLPGFISPTIVGVLTNNNQTVGQWQKVFLISAAMLILPAIVYVLFAKSELQEWNDPIVKRRLKDIEAEMVGLREDGDKEQEHEHDRVSVDATSKDIKQQASNEQKA